jgi:DNA-directed RNA polymerase beta' subunit
MKINIVNIDKFVEINNCPKVTNPIFLDTSRYPTKDGIFSYEIFGIPGSYDRKTIFGYIDLKRHYLHPVIYKLLTSMDKRTKAIIDGSKYFRLEKGELIEDSENGETGLDFLYKNLKKIEFKTTGSRIRDEKLVLLDKMSIDEIFITKWLIIPAFYRDLNFAKVSSGKEAGNLSKVIINDLYVKLISKTMTVTGSSGFDFMSHISENSTQLLLVEIYNELVQDLATKNGFIHKALMGKAVDYASRLVISAPKIRSETWNEQRVDFEHSGIPLAQLCVLFFPFFMKGIKDFLEEELSAIQFVYDEKDNKINLKNPMEDYTPEKIKKLIKLFIKSVENRFDILTVNTEKGYLPMMLYYEDLERDFTLTDLMYIVADKIIQDKHVFISRYPIEHFQGIYPSKIFILSTYKTKKQKIKNRWFEDYPEIYLDYPEKQTAFIDTLNINNAYLSALGGDYDGDMVPVRGLFSQEANMEANRIMNSKSIILDASGNNVRKMGHEVIATLYSLTKD